MAVIVSAWNTLSSLAEAMQNAVPNTFSKVEIAESGDYTGQLVAYDGDNNICLRVVSNTNLTLCFRDGSTLPITANWDTVSFGVCANGVILYRNSAGHIMISKDHRGKIAFANTGGASSAFDTYSGDSNSSTRYSYGDGQSTDQTNLCRMMVPKGELETNYFEHAYISQQYNLSTSPMICQIAGHTCILCYRLYLMDD